jgi:hypothetical protein
MANDKIEITNDGGERVLAQAPVIVSASRSTDIPGFYSDWFLHRLKKRYSAWTNPFNGVKSYVSYDKVRLIVFWSKNPEPLLKSDGLLDYLEKEKINTYIQYTLNDYVAEGLEKGVPPLDRRIDTFRRLVDRLGFGKVIWRFDPLILTDTMDVDVLLEKCANIGDQLKGYTEKMVFSFADIATYRKVKSNLDAGRIRYREFQEDDMVAFAAGLQRLNRDWGFTLATCGEKIDLKQRFGVEHNKCIDDDLMIKYFSDDAKLMDFLGVEITGGDLFNPDKTIVKHKNNKDKGQRQFCGCIVSKDIGQYNTCVHLCEYCYANSSKEVAIRNYSTHQNNPLGETITGQ